MCQRTDCFVMTQDARLRGLPRDRTDKQLHEARDKGADDWYEGRKMHVPDCAERTGRYVWDAEKKEFLNVPDNKFKAGEMVQARNGRGDVYMVEQVKEDQWGKVWYFFDNGAVNVKKRARTGWHWADRADKGFRVVT